MKPIEWTRELMMIKSIVEEISKESFTTVLLNQYRSGDDSMGWHRDNEKALGPNPVIASVSFGAERTFQFRHFQQKNVIRSIALTHWKYIIDERDDAAKLGAQTTEID